MKLVRIEATALLGEFSLKCILPKDLEYHVLFHDLYEKGYTITTLGNNVEISWRD